MRNKQTNTNSPTANNSQMGFRAGNVLSHNGIPAPPTNSATMEACEYVRVSLAKLPRKMTHVLPVSAIALAQGCKAGHVAQVLKASASTSRATLPRILPVVQTTFGMLYDNNDPHQVAGQHMLLAAGDSAISHPQSTYARGPWDFSWHWNSDSLWSSQALQDMRMIDPWRTSRSQPNTQAGIEFVVTSVMERKSHLESRVDHWAHACPPNYASLEKPPSAPPFVKMSLPGFVTAREPPFLLDLLHRACARKVPLEHFKDFTMLVFAPASHKACRQPSDFVAEQTRLTVWCWYLGPKRGSLGAVAHVAGP